MVHPRDCCGGCRGSIFQDFRLLLEEVRQEQEKVMVRENNYSKRRHFQDIVLDFIIFSFSTLNTIRKHFVIVKVSRRFRATIPALAPGAADSRSGTYFYLSFKNFQSSLFKNS